MGWARRPIRKVRKAIQHSFLVVLATSRCSLTRMWWTFTATWALSLTLKALRECFGTPISRIEIGCGADFDWLKFNALDPEGEFRLLYRRRGSLETLQFRDIQ